MKSIKNKITRVHCLILKSTGNYFTLVMRYFPILILCSCFDTICIVKSTQ